MYSDEILWNNCSLYSPPLFDELFSQKYQFKDFVSFQSNPRKMKNCLITNEIKCISIDLEIVMNVVKSNQIC